MVIIPTDIPDSIANFVELTAFLRSLKSGIQAAVASATQVDRYTTGTYIWKKPSGAKRITMKGQAAGGGAGSGRRGAAGTNRGGGGGGGAGGYSEQTYDADEVPDELTITVGAGGIGGLGATTDNTDGLQGTDGGDLTIMDGSDQYLYAGGGIHGTGAAGAAAGTGGGGGEGMITGGDGCDGGVPIPPSLPSAEGSSGGGGGGGISDMDVDWGGGPGIDAGYYTRALAGGNAASDGLDGIPFGSGGGGGNSNTPSVNGGDGGDYGAGGGGGAASFNGVKSGDGGNGAGGYAEISSSF